ncbi:MAG: hypothetical protein JXR84_16895 [Anaerolineae bacterium]|nr:hypothetical protein [Anaerolineae bacterium]
MRKYTRGRATKIILPIAIVILCSLVCTVAFMAYIVLADDEYIDVIDTEMTLDMSDLPGSPTEDDWYALAVQVLEANGWNASPNLTWFYTIELPCSPNPVLSSLKMMFADSYMDGLVPSVKYAELKFDRTTNTVTVHIFYSPMHWGHPTLDLSKTTVDFYQMLAVADAHGGQEFRESVNNACDIRVILTSRNTWSVKYRENGRQWENWEIRVNAITGKAGRYDLP